MRGPRHPGRAQRDPGSRAALPAHSSSRTARAPHPIPAQGRDDGKEAPKLSHPTSAAQGLMSQGPAPQPSPTALMVSLSNHERTPSSQASAASPGSARSRPAHSSSRTARAHHPIPAQGRDDGKEAPKLSHPTSAAQGLMSQGPAPQPSPTALMVSLSNHERTPSSQASAASPGSARSPPRPFIIPHRPRSSSGPGSRPG